MCLFIAYLSPQRRNVFFVDTKVVSYIENVDNTTLSFLAFLVVYRQKVLKIFVSVGNNQ